MTELRLYDARQRDWDRSDRNLGFWKWARLGLIHQGSGWSKSEAAIEANAQAGAVELPEQRLGRRVREQRLGRRVGAAPAAVLACRAGF